MMKFNARNSAITALLLIASCAIPVLAAPPPGVREAHARHAEQVPVGRHLDQRYNHNRYYPQRGQVEPALPSHSYVVRYRDAPYYFHEGSWYRPSRSRFVVVAPPIGLRIAMLPPFYTTIWWGGLPYYYANDVYYRWRPEVRSYEVVAPPQSEAEVATQAATAEPYVYPAQGQSDDQQADDRYACHRWAVDQTGFDPSQPADSASTADQSARREGYQRAMTACLEGRGYTVR